jgi:dolichol-phosphate mannosyltransferase
MLNAVTSFSLRPLRLFTWLGFALVAASVIAVPVYVFLHIAGNPPPGLTTLIILGLLGIGVNSLGIGILGEYLGRTYAETKHRPLFVIAETSNIEMPEMSRGLVASPGESAPADQPDDL